MKKEIQYYYQAEVRKGRSQKQYMINVLSSVEVEIPEIETAPIVMEALLKTTSFSSEDKEVLEESMIFRGYNDDLYVSFFEKERYDLLDDIETIMDVWPETETRVNTDIEIKYNKYFNFSGDFPFFHIRGNIIVEEENLNNDYFVVSSNKKWVEDSLQKGFSKNFICDGKMYIPSGLPVLFKTKPYSAYHAFSRLKPLRMNETDFHEIFESDRTLYRFSEGKITKINLSFHDSDKILSLKDIVENEEYGVNYGTCNTQDFKLVISDSDFIKYIAEKTNYENDIFYLRIQAVMNKVNINPSAVSIESLENLIQFKLALKQLKENINDETIKWCATQMKILADGLGCENFGRNIQNPVMELYKDIMNPTKREIPYEINKYGDRISIEMEPEFKMIM